MTKTKLPPSIKRRLKWFYTFHDKPHLTERLVLDAYLLGKKHGAKEVAIRCGKCSKPLRSGGGIGPIHCANKKCPEYDDGGNW